MVQTCHPTQPGFSMALDTGRKSAVSPTSLSSKIISVLWAQLLASQVPNFPPGSLPIEPEQK